MGSYAEILLVQYLGMGRKAWCLSISSILVKYCDKILQPTLLLSAHIMVGKLKILETNPKYEEVAHIHPIFLCICRLLK